MTLKSRDMSAGTTPSLHTTLGASKELFEINKDGWDHALKQTRASRGATGGGDAAKRAVTEDFYGALEAGIDGVRQICTKAQSLVDKTLVAVDQAIRSAAEVSVTAPGVVFVKAG